MRHGKRANAKRMASKRSRENPRDVGRRCANLARMLSEARAAGYVYYTDNDRLEVQVGSSHPVNSPPTASPSKGGSTANAPEAARANLLLSAAKKLVGIDARQTPAGCVLMLGAHEDVDQQAESPIEIARDAAGSLVAITIVAASKVIAEPAKNAY